MGTSELFVGISGVGCEVDAFDLGHGVSLKTTYAHLMAPFMVAFARPEQAGQPHPVPWAAASGGLAFDIQVEVTIPSDIAGTLECENTTAAWWIVALLRLRAGPRLRATVLSNYALTKDAASSNDLHIQPLEVTPYQLMLDPESKSQILLGDLEWIKDHWLPSFSLLQDSPKFSILVESLDQAAYNQRTQLALLMLWTGLEEMFSPSRSELRYRISSLIASYLEPPGHSRLVRQKAIAKLYDSRSAAAHGREIKSIEPLWETYYLVRETVLKMLDEQHVPSRTELEERLFGADAQ
ncbi:MAG: hypothetical protein IID37_07925 [Planctomycetes bacterium]|nr:hypothetical protein [Planctomycetota bacterium]